MTQERVLDENKAKARKPEASAAETKHEAADPAADISGLRSLQQSIGNRAVQRMLAQRSESEPTELDDETADQINRERGGGQALDDAVQASMSKTLGHDFSGVQVHTSPESDQLNRQLGAKAFTTGQDIFFREGAYEPHSSSGQELIGHELTHVVQQSTGQVSGSGRMTVNAPGDVFEQEADAIAKAVAGGEATTSASAGAGVQRQAEEEEPVQMQAAEEEEEEPVKMQAAEEEEEEEPST